MFTVRFSEKNLPDIAIEAKTALQGICADWEKPIWEFILKWADKEVTEIEIATSGSTGTPKPIKHSKQTMLTSARLTCETLGIPQGSTALLCLPANKVGGMMMIVRSIVNKMDLHCVQPSANPFTALEAKHNIQFAAFIPMQVKNFDNNYESFKKFEAIQTVILGGELVSPDLAEYLKHTRNNIYATFGMTETVSHIALKKINGKNPDAHFKTLPGVSIEVDENNCLIIDAPALGVHHLKTNDVVQIIGGNEFDWLGRIDNVINTGGIKIFPEAIEQKLYSSITAACFIGAIEDELTGQKPVLVIELPALKDAEIEALRESFNTLGKYERPKLVYLIPEFARTATGKINRAATLSKTAIKLNL